MKTLEETLKKILQFPIIPVFYHDDPTICTEIVSACYRGGMRIFEFVSRGKNAQHNFSILLEKRKQLWPELSLGIGTIKTADAAVAYIALGADFIVSPIINPAIAPLTIDKDILWIPGCMTPTEIHQAEQLGAPLVKLFPGSTLGPEFLRAIKPLFPEMRFMPTGGVNPDSDSISSWFNAGVSAVGMGSKLFQAPENTSDYNWLTERSADIMRIVKP